MKNNSFILLKEEKERIKKLYEATTAAASGSYNQPMGFSSPGLGGDVEVIDGDNIEDGSVEINLDIEDITNLLSVDENKDADRMRKLHRTNSVIEEQIDMPVIPEGCLECAQQSLKGDRELGGIKLGTYDYTQQVEMIMAAIIKGMSGNNPSTEELMAILIKLTTTVSPVDVPFIAAGLLGNECDGGGTAFDCLSGVLGTMDLPGMDLTLDQ